MRRLQPQPASLAGATLVELVVAIVILSISVTGVFLLLNRTTSSSADPMLREQALSIAESYLEEIMLQAYSDPGGPAESGRADYDDVDDYNGLADTGAVDRDGNVITELANYNVSVTVTATTLNGVPAKQITVTVSHANVPEINLSLTAYRTNY